MEINKRKTIEFIKVLRSIAVLLVVWDHLGCMWPQNVGIEWSGLKIINLFINKPLVLIQHFGAFGVSLFFIISGFIITHVIQRESRFEFVIKRGFRIYPPLIISTAMFYCFIKILAICSMPTWWEQFNIKEWILSGTLSNYFFNWPDNINGVTWTLIIEVMFYFLCFIFMNCIKKSADLTIILMFVVNFYSINISNLLGKSHILIQSIAYIPIVLFGQIIYYYWAKWINTKKLVIYCIINYLIWVQNLRLYLPEYYEGSEPYGPSLVYAIIIFLTAMACNDRLEEYMKNKKSMVVSIINYSSKNSYSIYLNHMTFGTLFLTIFNMFKIPFGINFILTLFIVLFISKFMNKYIENLFIQLSNKILVFFRKKKGYNAL